MLSLISIILQYKKTVAIVVIAVFVVSAVVSLVLPHRFISSAAFLPGGVERELTGHRDYFYQLGSFGETYAAFMRARRNLVFDYIVRSRKMSDLMSDSFNLEEVYDVDGSIEVNRKLREHTRFTVRSEGVIVISVEDRSPDRAKAMVEAYLHNLDSLLIELMVEHAGKKRSFLENELARRGRRIASIDSAIKEFMEERGVYELEKQARAALEVAAALRARLGILEIEKKLLEMTLKDASPEFERVKFKLEKMEEQLLLLKEGGGEGIDFFPPLSEFPDVTSEYMRLFSEKKMQEFAYSYVQLMMEDSRISENRKVSVIRIIDPPVVPDKRIWPKRKQIVIVSTLAALFWTCLFLTIRESWRKGMFRFPPPLPAGSAGGTRSGIVNVEEEDGEGENR